MRYCLPPPQRHPRIAELLLTALCLSGLWLTWGSQLFAVLPGPTTFVASDDHTLALLTWMPASSASVTRGRQPATAVSFAGSWHVLQIEPSADGATHITDRQGLFRGQRQGTGVLLSIGSVTLRGWLARGQLQLTTPVLLAGIALRDSVWRALPSHVPSLAITRAFWAAENERAALTQLAGDLRVDPTPPTTSALVPSVAESHLAQLRADLAAMAAAEQRACHAPADFAAALGKFTMDAEISPNPFALPFTSSTAALAHNRVAQDFERAQRAGAHTRAAMAALPRGDAVMAVLVRPWMVSSADETDALRPARQYVQGLSVAATQAIAVVRALQREAAMITQQVYLIAASVHC